MKPAPFEFHAPTSLSEALALLVQHGGDAKVMSGGQSLMPLLAMRLARPAVLVDLNGVAELDYLEACSDGLRLGALTRERLVERSPLVARHAPLLREATRWIGHPAIRSRGTIGGSLAHADPAAEYPAALVALDARVAVAGPGGHRTIAARDFFLSYLTTALGPNEVVTGLALPPWPDRAGACFYEVARRHGDFALVGAAVWVQVDAAGRCQQSGIALCGAGATPVRAEAAEALLAGSMLTPALVAAAAGAAAEATEPDSDLHASAAHRRRLAAVVVERALHGALGNVSGAAQGGGRSA